ncbi:MAG: site-2 protease family protein, partial [Balneolaceae bacterium]|nr:site-2 protease family protein [Balneolaceae bacterium]
LSVTLAIMNMLPIPVLDGGHVMFLVYEGITRREPSEKVRMALQQIGFFIIIALFIYVTFNDIIRQF